MRPLVRRPIAHLFAVASVLALVPSGASATWSIIAVDAETGRLVIASATCVSLDRLEGFPSKGLMDVQAIVVPGVGVAAAQAGVDRTRSNQRLIYDQLKQGTDPVMILELLRADPDIERRQFGIVDMQGRSVGFSGSGNGEASLSAQGTVSGTRIHYSIQGNILAADAVVTGAVAAFEAADGTLADRVMAAMEAADAAGGDRRCSCTTDPVPDAVCEHRTAHVAYLLQAEPEDPSGQSFNDGDYSLYLNVTDRNIEPHENANPVVTLRMRYDALKASGA